MKTGAQDWELNFMDPQLTLGEKKGFKCKQLNNNTSSCVYLPS